MAKVTDEEIRNIIHGELHIPHEQYELTENTSPIIWNIVRMLLEDRKRIEELVKTMRLEKPAILDLEKKFGGGE